MSISKLFRLFCLPQRTSVFIDWHSYLDIITEKEMFLWQQSVRKKSLKNMS